ncbi:hypothetical protein Tco_1293926 [Tanacetum coccineum]
MAKAKENVLNVEIQIISSESVQNYQETTIKEPSLEDHEVIAMKMEVRYDKRTKNVSWLKHLMSWVSQELRYCAQCLIIENEDFVKEIAVAYLLKTPT